jgi:Flp pilus assembly protein TadD
MKSCPARPIISLGMVLALASTARAAPTRADAYGALARGDFAGAAILARAVVEASPHDGEALYVLGLAELGTGHSAAALSALDRAAEGKARVSLANLALHRGHALQGLGRWDEAAQAYERAAADPRLAPLAREQQERVQQLRTQAPPAQPGGARGSVAETEPGARAFMEGGLAYRAGRLEEAAVHFRLAAQLDPSDAESVMMEGITHARLGNAAAARRRLAQAVRLGLSDEDQALVQEYLGLLPGEKARPSPWSGYVMASVGAGVDSNVSLEALGGTEAVPIETQLQNGSPFASASFIAGIDWSHGAFDSGLGLTFLQIAYLEQQWDSLSFQSTGLDWTNRWRLGQNVRLSLVGRGELSASGLRTSYAPFQATIGIEPGLAVAEAAWTESRLSASLTGKQSLDPSFRYTSGRRFEATLTQNLRLGEWTLAGTLRYRRDDVGSRRYELGPLPADQSGGPCPGCPAALLVPYSYQAGIAGLRLASPADALFRIGLGARLEDRPYDPSYSEARSASLGTRRWAASTRRDRRAAASLDLHLGHTLGVSARYDLTFNRSQVATAGACGGAGPPCPPVVPGARDYLKHVVTVELEGAWF